MYRTLLPVLLLLTGCYDSAGTPPAKRQEATVTASLAEMRRLYAGTPFEVASNVVVEGYVTSSDEERNFYGTLTIEDGGAGAELMAGTDRLFNRYPTGSHLAVRLRGLTVAEHYGMLQFGRAPRAGSGYTVDFLGSQAALDRVVIRTGKRIDPAPAVVRLAELSADLCGRLVRFENMHYIPEELDAAAWDGYRRFTSTDIDPDALDDKTPVVYVFTRTYADWAGEPVPLHALTLTGILQYGKAGGKSGCYILKPRSRNDLQI